MPGMARINCLAGQPRAKDGLAFLNKYDGEHIVPEAIHQEELGVLESILPKNTDIPPVNFALVLVMSLSQIGSKIIQGEPGQKYTIYTFVLLLPLMLLLRVSVTLERWSRGFLPPINDPYAYGLGLHVLAGIYLAIIAVVTSPEHKFDSIILIYQVFLLVPELWPALLGGPLRLGPLLGALLGLLYLLPKTEINTTLELPQVQKAVHIAVVITGLYALSVLFLKLDFENWGSAIKRTQKKRVSFQDNRRVMVTRDYIEKNEGLYRRPSILNYIFPRRPGAGSEQPHRDFGDSLKLTLHDLYYYLREEVKETVIAFLLVHRRFIYLQIIFAPLCFCIGGCVKVRAWPPLRIVSDIFGFTYRWDASMEVGYQYLVRCVGIAKWVLGWVAATLLSGWSILNQGGWQWTGDNLTKSNGVGVNETNVPI